jgi:uncharacterized protein YcnI
MKYLYVALLPLVLCAHAVVSPASSRTGAYERYVLRVPNESDSPTIRVSIRFPPEVRVISFVDVPGWQLQATMDSSGRATAATWTGSLPPERFVEFPFMAVNPKSATQIAWPVVQVYQDGQVVQWFGPRDSEKPASITVVGGGTPWQQWVATVLAGLALCVAVFALALSFRGRVGTPTARVA